MFEKLGIVGIVGFLALLGGIGLLALHDIVAAGGVALVVAGLGLVVFGLVKNLLSAMGMDGMI